MSTAPIAQGPNDVTVMQHTPGPWIADDSGTDHPENMARCFLDGYGTENEWVAVGIADADGYAESVAYCHPNNANLIAAAPELLTALQEVVAISDRKHDAWDRAKAAIAKALNHEA